MIVHNITSLSISYLYNDLLSLNNQGTINSTLYGSKFRKLKYVDEVANLFYLSISLESLLSNR